MNTIASELDVHELEMLVGQGNIKKPLLVYQQILFNLLTELEPKKSVDKKWLLSTAHQIKSSARQLKLQSLAESAEQLERGLLKNNLNAQHVYDFNTQISYAYNALTAFLVANKLDK